MIKTQTTEFDNEMKALSQGVYMGNEKSIPKDWIKVSEYNKNRLTVKYFIFYFTMSLSFYIITFFFFGESIDM